MVHDTPPQSIVIVNHALSRPVQTQTHISHYSEDRKKHISYTTKENIAKPIIHRTPFGTMILKKLTLTELLTTS